MYMYFFHYFAHKQDSLTSAKGNEVINHAHNASDSTKWPLSFLARVVKECAEHKRLVIIGIARHDDRDSSDLTFTNGTPASRPKLYPVMHRLWHRLSPNG